MKKTHLAILLILLIIHLGALINLRFEAWPEMLVYPYLNLHKFLQYQDIVHPYPPLGIWLLSFWFRVVGISVANLQKLTWGLIIGIDGLLFWIAAKKSGPMPALVGLSYFILFQPLLDGNGLWFDLMLVPLLLIAYYRQSALLLAVSLFVKQSVIWLFPLFLKSWKKLIFSLLSLFLISFVFFSLRGAAMDYLFWSWQFPFTIFPYMPGHKDLGNWRWWLVGLMPLILPVVMKLASAKKLPKLSPTDPLWWMIFSLPFIFPRFGLFHFQPALAFAAISIAKSLHEIKIEKLLTKSHFKLLVTCYLLLVTSLWFRQIKYFWHQPPRFFEPEIISAATSLKATTVPTQPVLFLNAPDQLMVLIDRLPPKPWIATFPWYLEVPRVQENAISRWGPQPIQAVIFSPYQRHKNKYTPGSYAPQKINQFIEWKFPLTAYVNQSLLIKSALPK